MDEEKKEEGTCELVIYCHHCKLHYQLNPEMIALALVTKPSIWEIYEYILTTKCRNCKKVDCDS